VAGLLILARITATLSGKGLNEGRNSMDDDTTTTPAEDVQTGADNAQPVNDAPEVVADEVPTTEPSEAPQDSDVAEEATDTAPQVDDKLQKYAQSQGLELDSPSAIKAAQIAMKAQSEATKNYRQKSELEKTMETVSDEVAENVAEQTGQDPEVLKRLQRMEVKDSVREFWGNNPEAREYEQDMIRIVQEKPYLAGDYDVLYATALMQSGNAKVKSQIQKQTLQNLAHKQTAAVPAGNATNPGVTPKQKPFADLSISEMEARLGKVNG
jgi:hypothetical protein